MRIPSDSTRHSLRDGMLVLSCLVIGLPGCGPSSSGEGSLAPEHPQAATRRKELKDFYDKNQKKQPESRQARRQH